MATWRCYLVARMKPTIPTNWLNGSDTEYEFDFFPDPVYGLAWTTDNNDININMQLLFDYYEEYNKRHKNKISMDKLISLSISHELLHNVIATITNTGVSGKFDNICYVINKNFKQWLGGMPQ